MYNKSVIKITLLTSVECQNKAVRAAALTIFSKMGAKNREHNECILMTLFAL